MGCVRRTRECYAGPESPRSMRSRQQHVQIALCHPKPQARRIPRRAESLPAATLCLPRTAADTDGSAEQSHHLVAGRADGEDGFARVERAHPRKRNDLGPLVGTQAAKQTAIEEKVTGFLERPFVRTHGVVSPRGVSELEARLSRDHDVLAIDRAVNQKRSRSSKSRGHMTVI